MSDTAMAAPERIRHIGPKTGRDSRAVIDEAVASLGRLRMPTEWLGDGGAEVHLLTSLIAEAERQLPQSVALARDQDYSWAELGDLLGITRAAAWQRFGDQVRTIRRRTRRDLLANAD
ncbi:MAG: hypothetical protein M0Z42_05165 [Actinomycetota bacterium]|nr:hypothetical protein [Actinomycetota bacterium]